MFSKTVPKFLASKSRQNLKRNFRNYGKMPMKGQLKLGCYPLSLGYSRLLIHWLPLRHQHQQCPREQKRLPVEVIPQRRYAHPEPHSKSWNLLDIKFDIQRSEDKPEDISLPMLIYLYSPWKRLITKWNLWRLKFLWDWSFLESKFVHNSKQATVVITDMIRDRSHNRIQRCCTPMGYKQIKHDLLDSGHNGRLDLLRFQSKHIRRAIPMKVHLLRHYDHRFAFVDMIFVALRRTNDFHALMELREMKHLIERYANPKKIRLLHPLIFAEIFVRFRRDYSENAEGGRGRWLVSTYKIMNFDIMDNHPEYEIPMQRSSLSRIGG